MHFDLARIFHEMNIQGMTEPMLAQKAGVNVAYLNRIHRGIAKNPTPKMVKKLAKALKLDMRDLYIGDKASTNGKRRTA